MDSTGEKTKTVKKLSNLGVPKRVEIYRDTEWGRVLEETLDDFIAEGKLLPSMKENILIHFDTIAGARLAEAAPRLNFTAQCYTKNKMINKQLEMDLEGVNISLASFGPFDRFSMQGIDKLKILAHPPSGIVKKRGASDLNKCNPVTKELPSFGPAPKNIKLDEKEVYCLLTDDDESDTDSSISSGSESSEINSKCDIAVIATKTFK